MAIYTQLSKADIEEFLAQYDVGALESFKGISEGVTNTNYILTTNYELRITNYILTLFENHYKLEDLPYFTALMEWFSARGVECPMPVRMKDGRALGVLKDRPALMVSFLEGAGVEPRKITPDHMLQLGQTTARIHIAGIDFPHRRANPLSVAGWEKLVDAVVERADEIEAGLGKLISEEYNYLSEHWPSELPSGAIHADLFPDNVFFSHSPSLTLPQKGGGKYLSGIIDWYFACHDAWAYDLAVVVNAWCFDDRQRLVPERVTALMHGYNEMRSMTAEEDSAFPLLLRGAALRFLLTRTHDWSNPPEGAEITLKDPLEYARKLKFFQSYKL